MRSRSKQHGRPIEEEVGDEGVGLGVVGVGRRLHPLAAGLQNNLSRPSTSCTCHRSWSVTCNVNTEGWLTANTRILRVGHQHRSLKNCLGQMYTPPVQRACGLSYLRDRHMSIIIPVLRRRMRPRRSFRVDQPRLSKMHTPAFHHGLIAHPINRTTEETHLLHIRPSHQRITVTVCIPRCPTSITISTKPVSHLLCAITVSN